jgi:hypothetical protein
MERIETSEVIVRIPPSMASDVGGNEIVGMLLDKALGKRDFYKSRMRMFESKYGTNFAAFKKKTEQGNEHFEEWDELLLWEGCELAYREWNRKYEDLKLCMR